MRNVNQAKGNFDGAHQAYQIGASDQLLSSDDYRPLIVAYRNGAPVKLTDVANVIDDVENVRQAAWMNEAPAVIMNIQRQPGANIIQVVDRIKSCCRSSPPRCRNRFRWASSPTAPTPSAPRWRTCSSS